MNTVTDGDVDTLTRASAATGDIAELERLRGEIEALDEQILDAIRARTALSRRIGVATAARPDDSVAGRIQQRHELSVVSRFLELGPEGRTLGMALLRLGRGRAHPAQRPNRVRYAPSCDQYAGTPDSSNTR